MDASRYPHILRAIYETPWAMRPQTLGLIVDLVRFRAAGGVLSDSEIRGRVEAARNGPRQGGGRTGTVAVIPVYGPITARQNLLSETSGGTSIEELSGSFRSALGDQEIDAIVLEVDSPGGTVDGIPELAAEIRAARGQKPVYAIANTMAASAAYWLASQCERLFVTPSGSAGSIGVFAAHHDLSGAYEADGDAVTLIAADVSPFKTEGNEYEPLSDEARANIQSQVDAFGQMFVRDVAKGRGIGVDVVRSSYGQGRLLLAADALGVGMVDGIETLDNVIRAASRAAATSSRAATAAAGSMDVRGLGTGLEFSDRVALVTAELRGLSEHASARAEMRARDGRSLSDDDRTGLLAIAGYGDHLRALADEEREPPIPEPEPPIPTPPAWAEHARLQLALAQAELGFDLKGTPNHG